MANLHDFFFRQRVTEQELDEGFEFLEQADFNYTTDNDLVGVNQGMGVAQTVVPSLNVEVAVGTAYSKQGERMRVGGIQTIDVSVDENSVSTEPAGGLSTVISVFIEFERVLSDPRIDGNAQTVFFNRFEGFKFIVRKGTEATAPVGGPAEITFIQTNGVAQDPNLIRLCDIIRANGQLTLEDADIFTDVLREDAFSFTVGTLVVRTGTIKGSDQANLQFLSNHINDVGGVHDATAITFDPTGHTNFTAGATNVDLALVEVNDNFGVLAANNVWTGLFNTFETIVCEDICNFKKEILLETDVAGSDEVDETLVVKTHMTTESGYFNQSSCEVFTHAVKDSTAATGGTKDLFSLTTGFVYYIRALFIGVDATDAEERFTAQHQIVVDYTGGSASRVGTIERTGEVQVGTGISNIELNESGNNLTCDYTKLTGTDMNIMLYLEVLRCAVD